MVSKYGYFSLPTAAGCGHWDGSFVSLDFADDLVFVDGVADGLLPPQIPLRDGLCERRADDDFDIIQATRGSLEAASEDLDARTEAMTTANITRNKYGRNGLTD